MNEIKRTYKKLGLDKEPLPRRIKKVIVENVLPNRITNILPLSYQKLSIEATPSVFFVIISGGQVREKNYFKLISNHDRFKRIKIDFIADPKKLSPKGMYEIAEYRKAHLASSQNEGDAPDIIFLVSDVDHFMDELIEIKPKCSAEHFHLIISNSCFEVWLYYAYFSDIPNFSIPEKLDKISWKFKGWLPSVIQGGVKPIKAILQIHQNIENSKQNYNEDQNGIPDLFCTNMFELAEKLLPLIEPELNKLVQDINEREAEFRKKNNSHAIKLTPSDRKKRN